MFSECKSFLDSTSFNFMVHGFIEIWKIVWMFACVWRRVENRCILAALIHSWSFVTFPLFYWILHVFHLRVWSFVHLGSLLEVDKIICHFIGYCKVDHPVHQMEAEESDGEHNPAVLVNVRSLHSKQSLWRGTHRSLCGRRGRRTS